jgi:hypothetical protein
MGITIHYSGTLPCKEAFGHVVEATMQFAEEHNLPFLLFGILPELSGNAGGDEGWLYPIQGICLQPDPGCDPVILEFNSELHMDHYCRTQFADISVHLIVIELLRRIESYFITFEVIDEGHYWEKQDLILLQQKRELTSA